MCWITQVMAPPSTSRRDKEDFVKWRDPVQVVRKEANATGVGSTSMARKSWKPDRERSVLEGHVPSQTPSESNSAAPGEADDESHRLMPPTVAERLPPVRQPSHVVAPNRFVPPRPTSAPASRGQPQWLSHSSEEDGRHASMSPQGLVPPKRNP